MNDGPMAPGARLVTFVDVDDSADHRSISVSAHHEAELNDGRRALLLDGRGWSESGPAGMGIVADAQDLERLPHDVVLSQRLLERLGRDPRP